MKKSLILLSLILSTASFAAVSNANETNVNGSMNITAEVIKPLKVKSEGDLAFGRIIQGSEHTKTSGYDISGQPGENITVTIPETATLTNTANPNAKMQVAITSTIPSSLDGAGGAKVGISGFLSVADAQALGEYSGELVAAVRYN